MIAGDYTPMSAVDIFVKDLGIVLETGKRYVSRSLFLLLPTNCSLMPQRRAMAARMNPVVKVFEQLTGISIKGMRRDYWGEVSIRDKSSETQDMCPAPFILSLCHR